MTFLRQRWQLVKPFKGTRTYECQVGPLVAQWGGDFKRFESKTQRESWEQYGYGNMFKIPFIGYMVLWIYRG